MSGNIDNSVSDEIKSSSRAYETGNRSIELDFLSNFGASTNRISLDINARQNSFGSQSTNQQNIEQFQYFNTSTPIREKGLSIDQMKLTPGAVYYGSNDVLNATVRKPHVASHQHSNFETPSGYPEYSQSFEHSLSSSYNPQESRMYKIPITVTDNAPTGSADAIDSSMNRFLNKLFNNPRDKAFITENPESRPTTMSSHDSLSDFRKPTNNESPGITNFGDLRSERNSSDQIPIMNMSAYEPSQGLNNRSNDLRNYDSLTGPYTNGPSQFYNERPRTNEYMYNVVEENLQFPGRSSSERDVLLPTTNSVQNVTGSRQYSDSNIFGYSSRELSSHSENTDGIQMRPNTGSYEYLQMPRPSESDPTYHHQNRPLYPNYRQSGSPSSSWGSVHQNMAYSHPHYSTSQTRKDDEMQDLYQNQEPKSLYNSFTRQSFEYPRGVDSAESSQFNPRFVVNINDRSSDQSWSNLVQPPSVASEQRNFSNDHHMHRMIKTSVSSIDTIDYPVNSSSKDFMFSVSNEDIDQHPYMSPASSQSIESLLNTFGRSQISPISNTSLPPNPPQRQVAQPKHSLSLPPSASTSLQQLQSSGYDPSQRRASGNMAPLSRSLNHKNQSTIPIGIGSNVNQNQLNRSHEGALFRLKGSNDRSTDNASGKLSPSSVSSLSPGRSHQQQDLVDSPRTKGIYKDFYRVFRAKERESIDAAKAYAIEALSWVPEKSRWKIFVELAELNKRSNEFDEARKLYEKVTKIQPLAWQGWLEWSKMEEEYGCFEKSYNILLDGLKYCSLNEGLLSRAVKHHERRVEYNVARQLLSGLRNESIDRIWKLVLEGALFEVRTGEFAAARKIFQLLMQHVSWYGPIYYEAYRLDEKEAKFEAAYKTIQKGLKVLPRYGPLWFGLLKIMERRDVELEEKKWLAGRRPKLIHVRFQISKAVMNISPELIWKIYFEQSQAEERAADDAAYGLSSTKAISVCTSGRSTYEDLLTNVNSINAMDTTTYLARNEYYKPSRISLVRSLLVCPNNLKWKVWLAGSRLELNAGNLHTARQLLCFAFADVPSKSKSYVYLEASRVEEYSGNVKSARKLLLIARKEISIEWKLHLEAILLEARAGHLFQAIKLAENSLKYHSGTGRLWAVLILLSHRLETIVSSDRIKYEFNSNIIDPNSDNNETDDEIISMMNQKSSINMEEAITDQNNHNFQLINKFTIFVHAIKHVPKSGEVWCEGARCLLNPMNTTTFDINRAQKFLQFAIQFTPQYGDAFIEYVRLEMIIQVMIPIVLRLCGINVRRFMKRFMTIDIDSDMEELLNMKTIQMSENESFNRLFDENGSDETVTVESIRHAIVDLENMISYIDLNEKYSSSSTNSDNKLPNSIELLQLFENVSVNKLFRRCSNADPNYGTLWFHCRHRPFDSSTDILNHAKSILAHELIDCTMIYFRAILYYIERLIQQHIQSLLDRIGPSVSDDPIVERWIDNLSSQSSIFYQKDDHESNYSIAKVRNSRRQSIDEETEFYQHIRFLKQYRLSRHFLFDYQNSDQYKKSLSCIVTNGMTFLSSDFISGMIHLNRLLFKTKMSDEDRRKILFGFDQIVS